MLGPGAAVFSLLLVLTGLAKSRRPADTSRALAALGFPNNRLVGLMIGLVEIGVGGVALITGNSMALMAQAALYAAFATWIAVALARDLPIASCGCLGTPDTPPYWGHLVLDVTAALFSLGAALTVSESLLQGTGAEIIAVVILVGVGAYLAWQIIGQGARVRETYSA